MSVSWIISVLFLFSVSCTSSIYQDDFNQSLEATFDAPTITEEPIGKSVVAHAYWQCTQNVKYDGSYVALAYPGGDVPADKGVCTDVVIRAYRSVGKDLQVLIHEYMKSKGQPTDKNIDHRRCTNLRAFFEHQGTTLPISSEAKDYQPGDLVFWDIAAGHVGIVVDEKVPGTERYYIVHNICCGPKKEDYLFKAKTVLHVRWKV